MPAKVLIYQCFTLCTTMQKTRQNASECGKMWQNVAKMRQNAAECRINAPHHHRHQNAPQGTPPAQMDDIRPASVPRAYRGSQSAENAPGCSPRQGVLSQAPQIHRHPDAIAQLPDARTRMPAGHATTPPGITCTHEGRRTRPEAAPV